MPTAHYSGDEEFDQESLLSSDYQPGAPAFAHNPLMRWLMTKNSCNDKIGMRFLIFGVLIGCALLAAGAMADVQNVTLSLNPGLVGPNSYEVGFCLHPGLNGTVNAVFITFDENTTVPKSLETHPECITVTSEKTGMSGHPKVGDVWVLPDYIIPGTTTVKIITPVTMSDNSCGKVKFETCAGINTTCPVDCEGTNVWVHTYWEPNPVPSNTFFLQVAITATLIADNETEQLHKVGGVIIEPDGTIVRTGESDTLVFDACQLHVYTIVPDECHFICNVIVDDFMVPEENLQRFENHTVIYDFSPFIVNAETPFLLDPSRCNATITANFCPSGVCCNGTLTLEKSAPATVNRCDNFTYTLQFMFESNTTGAMLNDTVLVDQLSPEVVFVSADHGGVFNETSNTVTWEIGTLDPGTDETFSINVTASGPACGSVALNSATINGTLSCNGSALTATDNVETTIQALPVDLVFTKIGPESVNLNDTFTYTLAFAFEGNSCAPSLNDTLVTDELPAEVTFVSADKDGEFDPDTNTVIWTLGDIAPGTSNTFNVTVIADKECNITVTNDANITGFVCTETPLVMNASVQTYIECPPPICNGTLTLEKSGPAMVNVGENFTYTLEFQFESDTEALLNDTVLVDQLPAEIVFISADHGGVFDETTNTVTWEIGDLSPGTSETFSINATASGPACGSVALNSATINGTLSCNGSTLTATDNVETTIVALPVDLTFTKEGTELVNLSDTFTYTLAFAFEGDPSAPFLNGTLVTDQLSPEVSFVSADKDGEFDEGSHSVIWTLGNIAPGTSNTFNVTVIADKDCNITAINEASITGIVCAEAPLVKNASVQTFIRCPECNGTLTLDKTGPTFVDLHETFTYALEFNFDSDTGSFLDNTVLVDQLPPEVEFVSADKGGVFDPATRTVTWTIGNNIAPGTSDTFALTVNATGPFTTCLIDNTAEISGLLRCNNSTLTDFASWQTEVDGGVHNVSLNKTASVAEVGPNGRVTYTLVFCYTDSSCLPLNLTNGGIVDFLPDPNLLRFESADKGGVFHPENNTVTWNFGDIPPNTCGIVNITLFVPVREFDPFTFNNATFTGIRNGQTLQANSSVKTMVNPFVIPSQAEFMEFQNFNRSFVGGAPATAPVQDQNVTSGLQFRLFDWNFKIF